MRLFKKSLIIATTAITAFTHCGKKSSDSDAASTTDPVTSNPAALAYPTSLAITAFPASTSTTLAEVDATDGTGAAKTSEQSKILSGEADSCLPKVMDQKDQDITANTCYEFDQEMIYGTKTMTGKTAQTYGTVNGKDSAGEACLVAFARAQVKRVVGQVDRSLALAQMSLCQRKKDGTSSQPAIAEEVDLAPFLKKVIPKGTVNSAKMTRLADASDGAKVFSMTFDVARPDGTPMIVNIVHSPKDDTNSAYSGVMYMQINELDATGVKATKTRLVSIMYERAASKMKYSLRTGRFASGLVSKGFGTDGQVDFNAGTDSTYTSYTGYATPNDAVDGMTLISFEGNPTTNEGTFSYWQNPGGNYTERARGMLSQMTYDATTGTLSGCSVSGAAGTLAAGVSIRSSIKESKTLEPNGALHPFFHNEAPYANSCSAPTGPTTDSTGTYYSQTCPTQTNKWFVPTSLGANGTTFVTAQQPLFYSRQCFKQNTAGLYEIDTALTTAAAGYELIAITDTSKKISPPAAPAPGAGVKK